jgi:hypothetical protein
VQNHASFEAVFGAASFEREMSGRNEVRVGIADNVRTGGGTRRTMTARKWQERNKANDFSVIERAAESCCVEFDSLTASMTEAERSASGV